MRQEPGLRISQKPISECKSILIVDGFGLSHHLSFRFKHAWADIDTQGTGYIQKEDVAKLLRKMTGRFTFKIYDDSFSIENLTKVGRKSKSGEKNISASASPKSPGTKSGYSSGYSNAVLDVDIKAINKCLSKLDVETTRKKRLEYNLYYKVTSALLFITVVIKF